MNGRQKIKPGKDTPDRLTHSCILDDRLTITTSNSILYQDGRMLGGIKSNKNSDHQSREKRGY